MTSRFGFTPPKIVWNQNTLRVAGADSVIFHSEYRISTLYDINLNWRIVPLGGKTGQSKLGTDNTRINYGSNAFYPQRLLFIKLTWY